jgi:hypothetical protein
MGETCESCGRHHISPVPFKCSRCSKDMRTGCLEGVGYRVVDKSLISGPAISRSSLRYCGGNLIEQQNIIRTEKVDDEFGKMIIEFLQPTRVNHGGDTSLFPK